MEESNLCDVCRQNPTYRVFIDAKYPFGPVRRQMCARCLMLTPGQRSGLTVELRNWKCQRCGAPAQCMTDPAVQSGRCCATPASPRFPYGFLLHDRQAPPPLDQVECRTWKRSQRRLFDCGRTRLTALSAPPVCHCSCLVVQVQVVFSWLPLRWATCFYSCPWRAYLS